LIAGSLAVFGEQTAGGGISAKKRIDEIVEKNNLLLKCSPPQTPQINVIKTKLVRASNSVRLP